MILFANFMICFTIFMILNVYHDPLTGKNIHGVKTILPVSVSSHEWGSVLCSVLFKCSAFPPLLVA